MKVICIRCYKKYEVEERPSEYICTNCVKEIIKHNKSLAEEYIFCLNHRECKTCKYEKTDPDKAPCIECSFYSNWDAR